jgi:predicted PurR-regulated permease PerM
MTAESETGGRGWARVSDATQPAPARPRGRRRRRANRSGSSGSGLGRLWPWAIFGIAVLLVTVLYLARVVLIPIALAVLLTFLVHPIVTFLSRVGLGRVPSVILVVFLLFSVLGGVAYTVVAEFGSLSEGIPGFRDHLIAKITSVRSLAQGGVWERAHTAASEVKQELEKDTVPPKPRETPTPVVIRSQGSLWQLPSLFEGLATAAVVLLLVIFMLLEREELRNRFLRLVGHKRLTTATHALDEVAQRISRYLVMQSVVNTSFGLGIAIGLLVVGVPYALLWGFLAAALRFIPYVGPWLGAVVLVTFCLAAFADWWHSLIALGLFAALEVCCSFVLEPLLYGHSAGVSQVALLISISFWTWLWGPVGLMLATPLTVCLVVLAKHVPDLEFLTVLMADQPPLAPALMYYQRLIAGDHDEAATIVATHLKSHSPEAVYDGVVLPALGHARRDRQRHRLSAADERIIWAATREIVEDIGARLRSVPAADPLSGALAMGPAHTVRLLACPAHDEADELALLMLRQLLDSACWTVDTASPHLLTSEVLALVEEAQPAVLCIGAGPSGVSVSQTRHLCKRLRARFAGLKIVVGQWGVCEEPANSSRRLLEAAGADFVGTSLVETREQLQIIHGLDHAPASGAVAVGLA